MQNFETESEYCSAEEIGYFKKILQLDDPYFVRSGDPGYPDVYRGPIQCIQNIDFIFSTVGANEAKAAKAAPSVRDLNSTNCRKLKARCASLEHEHCCQALSDGIKTTKRGKEGRVKRFCTGL
ncbi:hypothetical protein SRHO_G00067830 [Serrasalmus rhombeus]